MLRRARAEGRAAAARAQHRVRHVLLDAVSVVGIIRAWPDVPFGRAVVLLEALRLAAHRRHRRGVARLDRAHLRLVARRPRQAGRRVLHPLRRRGAERAARPLACAALAELMLAHRGVRARPGRVDGRRLHLQCPCRQRAERTGARAARAAVRTSRAASHLTRPVRVVRARVSEIVFVPCVPPRGRFKGCTCTALGADAPGRLVSTGTRCLRSSVGTPPQRRRVQRRALRRRWGWRAPIGGAPSRHRCARSERGREQKLRFGRLLGKMRSASSARRPARVRIGPRFRRESSQHNRKDSQCGYVR